MPYSAEEISRVTRSKEQARAAYNRMSRWYDVLAGGFESRHRMAGLHKLNPGRGEVILEVGVGTGGALVALAEAVSESGKIYGIDLSPGMLTITRRKLEKAGLMSRVVLESGDAALLPFSDQSFDALFMSFTLELFDTPEIPVVLSECRRVIKTGGRMCVVALAKQHPPNLGTRLYEWLHQRLPDYMDCRPIYVQESVRRAGFCIVSVTEFSMFGLLGEIVLASRE